MCDLDCKKLQQILFVAGKLRRFFHQLNYFFAYFFVKNDFTNFNGTFSGRFQSTLFFLSFLIIINSKSCRTTKQRIVHKNITGITIRIRIPKTSCPHSYSFSSLLTNDHFYNNFISFVTQIFYVCFDLVRNCSAPIWHLVRIIGFTYINKQDSK